MNFVIDRDELYTNAEVLADAIHDGDLNTAEAAELVARGRVFLPFRYGDRFVFAPAKFIGYHEASVAAYKDTARDRHGGKARDAISRLLKIRPVEETSLERQLENYCEQIGVDLRKNKHTFWVTKAASGCLKRDRSAIHDIDAGDVGNSDPEYRKRMAGTYVRVQAVRRAVLRRAGGICEFCSEVGFTSRSGEPFLETHHVISLSEQGPDTTRNVIALCPNDHRRAHFGTDWEELQTEFLTYLKAKAA